ncbi:transcriptional regulator [Arachnia propionica]|uniref:Transcriptional regulator n=1 Tax=Arachnia propionica TaxID=1750 RepID=A0A3P1T9Q0_9ACTN|nr:LCP family protein [Arachnia propionica]RRD06018.1 transcriptional regulator [Arachnia propionica]
MRRRGWVKILIGGLAVVLALVVGVALGGLVWVNSSLQRLPVSLPGSKAVWLVVGVDDRAAADEEILEDTGTGEPGARADVLLLARAEGGTLRLLSVDRRVVALDASGTPARLGASWLEGPQRTVDLFCQGLGVGVGHVVQVDFAGLVEVVDALGGIEIRLDHALRDGPAHLELGAGVQRVDGRTALALVRSRQGELLVDGQWQPETRGAEGRQHRAGTVLTQVVHAMRQAGPGRAWEAADVARRRLAVDPGTGVLDVLSLRDLELVPEVLVTEPVAEEDLMTGIEPEGQQQLDVFRDGSC